jgi:protein-S-isoprenylcysteine O-methyltransferase Ste14
MSLIPAFEIGLWNAWIFWASMILSMIIPDFFKSKEAKERSKRASQFVPFNKKKDKILAYSTHIVIMPISIIYSIFLPLRIGTAWFYTGLVILISALVISLMSTISFANTPVDRPFTRGMYSISRHPIYLSGFLINLSIAIASVSWIIMLCAILWIVFFHIVIPAEESHLIGQYGEAYREYMDRTPKWIGIPKSKRK